MKRPTLTTLRSESQRFSLIVIGALITALGYALFQVPFRLAAGGVGGLSIIINSFTGWPIGIMILVLNVPLLAIGYTQLGGWRFVINTVIAVLVFSLGTDAFIGWLPTVLENYPISNDILLSAVYAGIVGGIGLGIVYRAGATIGGTGILGRIIQQRTGIPLSQVYIYTDGGIIALAGIAFGWEIALYALLTLFLNGLATDYTMEGPSSVRTATIITDQPQRVSDALINGLDRGVSQWQITGAYTGKDHSMLMCTVYRPQVNALKHIVADTDPNAFITIGLAHQALGYGFQPLKR